MHDNARFAASACLSGEPCRYDGRAIDEPLVLPKDTLLVCPEILGGLGTPREPAEICGGDGGDVLNGIAKVITRDGVDVTAEYVAGAKKAVRAIMDAGIACVLVKSKSPSCGYGKIHDGSFGGGLTDGNGVFAELARRNGIIIEERK